MGSGWEIALEESQLVEKRCGKEGGWGDEKIAMLEMK